MGVAGRFGPVTPLSVGPDGWLYGTTRQGGYAGPLATSAGVGVLFRLDSAHPTLFGTLHHFGTAPGYSDGATPSGAAVPDGHGNFYGATNSGAIYKWDGFAVTPVHQFARLQSDRTNVGGANPYGSPVFGGDGKLYGMTIFGGTSGGGTVYVLDPVSQDFQVLYNFASYTPPCNADNAPLQSLMLASNGILYGTTEFGGAHGGGLIFKVTPPTTLPAAGDATHGEVTILHDFGPCSAHASPRFSNADGAYPLGTLTEGADGLLYGTTYYGGANGVGTIFRIAKDGSGFESLYSFVPGHDAAGTGAYPATGLVRLPDDSLVGTTFLGGLGYGVVYRVTGPPTVSVMPAPVTAIRTGRGPLSRTVRAVVANGQAPYSYAWAVDEPDVGLRSPAAQSTEVFTSLAACDTAAGTLSVTVTDALGRSASATTDYTFEATRPNGGVCD